MWLAGLSSTDFITEIDVTVRINTVLSAMTTGNELEKKKSAFNMTKTGKSISMPFIQSTYLFACMFVHLFSPIPQVFILWTWTHALDNLYFMYFILYSVYFVLHCG